jgi:hypothetical protein
LVNNINSYTNANGKKKEGSNKGRGPGPVTDKEKPLAEKESSQGEKKLWFFPEKDHDPS